MGGAIAVHIAARKALPTLVGLCVIDVVEGRKLSCLFDLILRHLMASLKEGLLSVEEGLQLIRRFIIERIYH